MSTIDLNRRGLFKAGAVIAAASTISSIPVVAQAAEEPEKKKANELISDDDFSEIIGILQKNKRDNY